LCPEPRAFPQLVGPARLEYDQSSRDQETFNGLKRLYGFGDTLSFSDFRRAVKECDGRHNYTGDSQAVGNLLEQYKTELGAAGAGEPAIAVA
jgi:hypothetical protein